MHDTFAVLVSITAAVLAFLKIRVFQALDAHICAKQVRQNLKSCLAVIGINFLIASLTWLVISSNAEHALGQEYSSSNSNKFSVVRMVAFLISHPVAEEILFRGIIFVFLRKYFSMFMSAALSSVVFGLCHYPFFINITLGGLYLVIVFIKTNSLAVTILLHSLNNVISLTYRILIEYIDYLPDSFAMAILFILLTMPFALIVIGWRDLVALIKSGWHKENCASKLSGARR